MIISETLRATGIVARSIVGFFEALENSKESHCWLGAMNALRRASHFQSIHPMVTRPWAVRASHTCPQVGLRGERRRARRRSQFGLSHDQAPRRAAAEAV